MLSRSLARVRKLRPGWAENNVARKSSRPPELLYAVDEMPPPVVLVASAFQHVAVIAITLVFALIIGKEAGLSRIQFLSLVSLSMMSIAALTLARSLVSLT
jgi:xanthine/uracil permease